MDSRDAPGARFETRIDDGMVYVESRDDWIEVGPLDDIVESIGGETYVIEYESFDTAQVDWLDTDDGRLEIDVRDTIEEYAYQGEFVQAIADVPPDPEADTSQRPELFADMVTAIWDSKGNLDDAGEP